MKEHGAVTNRDKVKARSCVVCQAKFKPAHRDAAYCSAACRQRAARLRINVDDLDKQISEARRLYWRLVRQKAEALRVSLSQVAGFLSVRGSWGRSMSSCGPTGCGGALKPVVLRFRYPARRTG